MTRRTARREARALFDLCAGFVYAQVLAACVELGLFEILAAGPATVESLSARCDVPLAAMRMLLEAAVSLRLLQPSGARFRLGRLGAALRGNPGVAAMVSHHRLFYADLADPVALLRGGVKTRLGGFWPYRGAAGDVAGDAAGYAALMAATQPMIAAQIFGVYDFSKARCVLDVGGGDGAFLLALAARAAAPRLILFDLPAVAARGAAALAVLGPRAVAVGGDVFVDPLPAGADVVTLIRVLHDHDDAAALAILRAARAALGTGGTLLIAEPLAGTGGAAPVGAAYFGFYLLAMGSGRARRQSEIEAMLMAAGFGEIRRLRTAQPMLARVLSARVTFS